MFQNGVHVWGHVFAIALEFRFREALAFRVPGREMSITKSDMKNGAIFCYVDWLAFVHLCCSFCNTSGFSLSKKYSLTIVNNFEMFHYQFDEKIQNILINPVLGIIHQNIAI